MPVDNDQRGVQVDVIELRGRRQRHRKLLALGSPESMTCPTPCVTARVFRVAISTVHSSELAGCFPTS